MGQSKKISWDATTRGSPTATTTKRKDVWTTLLQISVWHALAEGRLHHRPHRAHHHRHRDHRQRGQVLTVRERGGLRGQRRLHRPHHQVLCLRRLLRHPLLCSPVHRSENETPVPSHLLDSHHPRLQHQVPLRLLRQRLDKLGGLGVHLLPGLLHRRHLGGRRLHQGVRHHQQWRCCPRLWCSASLQGLRRSFTIFYYLPIIHAFQSSQNRYQWNLLTNVFLSRSLARRIVLPCVQKNCK